MSFSFCSSYKTMLKADIKDNIRSKIEKYQNDNNWSQFDDCIHDEDNIDLSSLNYEDIVSQREIWEDIAKLSMDLWRDYDHYRHFVFESRFDDKNYFDRLISLEYSLINGRWTSFGKPSEDVVLTHLFVYGLYRYMSNQMTICNADVDKIESLGCFYCGNVLLPSNDSCECCGATIDEINELYEMSNARKNEELMLTYRNKDNTEVNDSITIGDGSREDNEQENRGNSREDSRKWRCRECAMMNESSVIDCEELKLVCKSVRRACSGCCAINNCVNTFCHCCGQLCVSVVTDVIDSPMDCRSANTHCSKSDSDNTKAAPNCSELFSEKWTCELCGCFNKYSSMNCIACGGLFKNEKWRCRRCYSENHRNNGACLTCGFQMVVNHSLGEYQFMARRDERPISKLSKSKRKTAYHNIKKINRWQCQNCMTVNNNNESHCEVCNYGRNVPHKLPHKEDSEVNSATMPRIISDRYKSVNSETTNRAQKCGSCQTINDKIRWNCNKCGLKL